MDFKVQTEFILLVRLSNYTVALALQYDDNHFDVSVIVITRNLKTKQIYIIILYVQGFQVRTCIAFKWWTE